MRASISIIILLTAITSCGNKRNNGSNRNGMTKASAQFQCSLEQVNAQCLDLASPNYTPPRFFYYRQCYVEYKSCLRGFGY